MKTFRIILIILLFLAITVVTVVFLLSHDIAVLQPDGMIGKKQRNLFFDSALLMLLIVIPVTILCLVFAYKYRASNQKSKYLPYWDESALAEVIWWCVPFLIIIVLSIITWKTSHDLNPLNRLMWRKNL